MCRRVTKRVVKSGRSYSRNSSHASRTVRHPMARRPFFASLHSCSHASSSLAASWSTRDSVSSHVITRACVICHPPLWCGMRSRVRDTELGSSMAAR
eukprot:1323922-Rhodomonas_salina.1